METTANDTVIAPPLPVSSSPSAGLIRTVFTVAWMSVLLGVGLELLLIALAAGAGTASKLQPFIADLAQKISWGSFVCIGLAFGKVAGGLRPQVTGLMGFLAAPVGFSVARAAHKASEKALGLTSGIPAVGPSPYLLAGIKAIEYAALGLILGWMLKKAWSGAWSFMAVGLGAGVIFGGTIIGLMDWHAAKALAPVALATRGVNEILFPVGCALVLYAADSLSKKVEIA